MVHLICTCLLALLGRSLGSDVMELEDKTFSRIKEYDSALVMFYAPWCGYCKKMKPELEKAAATLSTDEYPVTLAKVDCTKAGRDTCKQFSVVGYPTLKIFRKGDLFEDYGGPRDAEGITSFMRRLAGPTVHHLPNEESIEKFLNQSDFSVISFFGTDSEANDQFKQISNNLNRKFRFATAAVSQIVEGYKDKVVLFRPKHLQNKFEPASVVFEGDISSGLVSFLEQNTHGLVGHRTIANAKEFVKPLVVAYYQVDYTNDPKGTNYWRNRILLVAKSYSDRFNFAISSKRDFQHELNEFGYDYIYTDKPLVCARLGDKKYRMSEEFSVESFSTFLKNLKEGSIKPFLKSEPIPKDNNHPVKQAVAKNFDKVVSNNGKDTLIAFYAPWCGHCKRLNLVYEELAEKLAGEDVVLAKFDATSNDIPEPYEVQGYPTIYWAPKDTKASPVLYDGKRELDDLIQFIAKHATSELKHYDREGKLKKDEL